MKLQWRLLPAVSSGLFCAIAAAPLLAAAAAPLQSNVVGDEAIVASLNPPPAGSSCTDAAARTSVYFNFAHPQFQVSQISLYLDGRGVPNDAVDEHWPTVTLKGGLHPGLNRIDVVASGAAGQTMDRRLQLQIGNAAGADAAAVTVACDDAAPTAQAAPSGDGPQAVAFGDAAAADPAATAAVPVPMPNPVPVDNTAAVEAPPPAEVEAPPALVDPAVYADAAPASYDYPAPVYIYSPYPVVALEPWVPFIPFFGFGYFYSNFHPWCPPPVFAYHEHWYGRGWNGDWHGGGWNGHGTGNGWGNGWRGGNGVVAGGPGLHRPQGFQARAGGAGFAPRNGFASHNFAPHGNGQGAPAGRNFAWAGRGTFSAYQAPHYAGYQGGHAAAAAPRPYATSATSFRGAAFGGHAAGYARAPSGGGWGGGSFHASAAPAFHGGGGGGGFHAGGGYHGGGGGGGGRHR
jgi:hypothetical protein